MRIRLRKHHGTEASVLLVALGLASLLILFMYYYLNLMRAQNVAVARSQAWNGAMAAAEAGVEEALAHLNPGTASAAGGWSANGWGDPVDGFYGPQTRSLAAGSHYSVKFSAGPPLTIISTGSVTVAAIPATLTRVVQVVATNIPLFTTAMATKYGITMNGSGFSTDSFDSSNPSLSPSTNGDVASVYGPVNAGNHTINGDLYLGSTAAYSGNSGNYTGKKYTEFNVDFPDVVLPATPWQSPPPGSLDTNYVHAFLSSGDYLMPDSGSIYVGTNVHVRLKVTATTFNPHAIMIAGSPNNSGKLTIYMAGTTLQIEGNGTLNQSGVAGNLNYYGLPSNTTISISGNVTFIGTIYAPSADLTIGSGGSGPQDFIGSSITRSVTLSRQIQFHFDESLLKTGDRRGYIVTSWSEL